MDRLCSSAGPGQAVRYHEGTLPHLHLTWRQGHHLSFIDKEAGWADLEGNQLRGIRQLSGWPPEDKRARGLWVPFISWARGCYDK